MIEAVPNRSKTQESLTEAEDNMINDRQREAHWECTYRATSAAVQLHDILVLVVKRIDERILQRADESLATAFTPLIHTYSILRDCVALPGEIPDRLNAISCILNRTNISVDEYIEVDSPALTKRQMTKILLHRGKKDDRKGFVQMRNEEAGLKNIIIKRPILQKRSVTPHLRVSSRKTFSVDKQKHRKTKSINVVLTNPAIVHKRSPSKKKLGRKMRVARTSKPKPMTKVTGTKAIINPLSPSRGREIKSTRSTRRTTTTKARRGFESSKTGKVSPDDTPEDSSEESKKNDKDKRSSSEPRRPRRHRKQRFVDQEEGNIDLRKLRKSLIDEEAFLKEQIEAFKVRLKSVQEKLKMQAC